MIKSLTSQLFFYSTTPHYFSSGIVEGVKCEHTWKSPHARRARRAGRQSPSFWPFMANWFWTVKFVYPSKSIKCIQWDSFSHWAVITLVVSKLRGIFLIFFAAVSREELDTVKRRVGRQHTTFSSSQNAACSSEFFYLMGRLCSGGKHFEWANVIFAAYFILRGCDTHINFLQLLLMVGMICPLMQEHFIWPLLKSKALQCG